MQAQMKCKIRLLCIPPRVYNKEKKRVLNVLYAPCKMFSESHMPEIQTLMNESVQFKYLIVGVASSASK